MKILCLYNNSCALDLFRWLQNQNNECILWSEELSIEWVRKQQFDLAVSYTYSRIIKMAPCCDLRTQTLKSSYDMLHEMAVEMFKKAFYYYDYWQEMKKQALGKGSYHTDKQGVELRKHITSFDMPVLEFLEEIRK